MKKLIALFLVITFLGMNCATYEKGEGINLEPGQKPGAIVIIQKIDGLEIKGELIAVKDNSLLLKEQDSGADVSVVVGEIQTITIMKKSKVLLGVGIGLLGGGALGGAIVYSTYNEGWDEAVYGLISGLVSVLFGLIGGIVVGAQAGKDKTIQIEGMPKETVEFHLKDLRKIARVPNFQ